MIRILINRTLLQDKQQQYRQLMRQLKHKASQVPGYLSGEVLVDSENSVNSLVMSNWQDVKSWNNWTNSEQRKATGELIREMLQCDEKISVYQIDEFKD